MNKQCTCDNSWFFRFTSRKNEEAFISLVAWEVVTWVKEWKRRKGHWSLAIVSRNATDLAAKDS
jgi:hypothetical protein